MAKFNLKKLNEVENKEEYHTEISYRFAALEKSDDAVNINRSLETIRENSRFHPELV
jgi:hypothetical protein